MAEQQPSHTALGQGQQQPSNYGRGLWVSYKVDLRTWLLSPIHSLVRLLRIMPPTTDPFAKKLMLEFNNIGERNKSSKGYNHVEGFHTALLRLYTSPKTSKLDRKRWKIICVSIYKVTKRKSVQHECMVATAKCHDDATVYIRIERRVNISIAANLLKRKQKTKSPAPDSDDTPESDIPVADPTRPLPTPVASKYAADDITYSKDLAALLTPKKEEEIETIHFAEDIFLPSLAILACTVNGFGLRYDLFGENCYWFTFVMTAALKRLYKHTVVKHGTTEAGCWNSISRINAVDMKDVVNQVVEKYPADCVEFDNEIRDTINNPESEIYLEERRRREEADRRREEEQRRREEEQCKREEEQRRREEADRRREAAEEEIKRLKALLEQKASSANQ